ncbi:protein arginine N-methyltransferase 1.6 [Dorcoceras hygrometricum]|uniref:Protein arginine N-methyltransferase 1.6 n=1 Tax=Dorcoceras hygrometricum TaxID=472368 RepID=A0A2Z7CHG7_9LAMI|nr:protein arginine N-methyltransferase 1.6 [Dorcoceras hygrometricum]
MFQLKLNPLTGDSEWILIEEEDTGKQTTPKALLATTSYLDMLNDTRRSRAFRLAIDSTITKPCHVLDIGAGTGLLSMMATRAMGLSDLEGGIGSEGMVTACESYLPMVKLMRKVLRANGMDGKIRVINKRSDELEVGVDIPFRADVVVSEILDSELLGEGLIPSLQHAHDKLLVENPKTVPYRATIYGQLVECSYLRAKHGLTNREAKPSGDGIHLVPSGMAGILCIKQQQFAMHCNSLKEELKLLSEPFKVFDFDFWRRPESSRETELHIKASNDGTIHAIISWWILQLDKEATIFYSTGPKWIDCPVTKVIESAFIGSENWCDHWKQNVWFAPSTDISVLRDTNVKLHAVHTETHVAYKFMTSPQMKYVEHHDFDAQDSQVLLSPERYALYGDNNWRCLMLNAIKRALQHRVSPLCLIADDSIFLTVAVAHLSKNSNVIPLFPGLGKRGSQYLQAVAKANGYTMDRIEIIKKGDLKLTLHEPHQRKVDLMIAEPFYYGNDNILPWDNLRFWQDRTLLDPILSKDVLIMPCRGLLRACVMYLPDLWQSRRCLQNIEGFDHSLANSILGACGDIPASEESPFLPFFVWQCGKFKTLSEIVTILEFDFSKPISPCSGKTQVQFREAGICHGLVVWIDWVMDVEDNASIITTGPDERRWKQAVKLFRKPVEVRGGDFSTEIKAFFDPTDGDLRIHYVFS